VVGGRQGASGFDGSRLRAIRVAAQLSQRQLAELIGVNNTLIASYEAGRTVPRVDRLAELAEALGVAPDELTLDEPADSLERLRVRAGLLQAEVAQRAGMTRTKYAAIERGQISAVSRDDALALAAALGADVEEVLTAQAVARAGFLSRLSPR
jgi:transcriptional regulator with XRE-family HTH domain